MRHTSAKTATVQYRQSLPGMPKCWWYLCQRRGMTSLCCVDHLSIMSMAHSVWSRRNLLTTGRASLHNILWTASRQRASRFFSDASSPARASASVSAWQLGNASSSFRGQQPRFFFFFLLRQRFFSVHVNSQHVTSTAASIGTRLLALIRPESGRE